jgi:tetratricopeptide (TPR) repeat protein
MLLASAQMAGDGRTALDTADELAATVTEQAARDIAWVQPIMAAPWFALAQFGAPRAVVARAAPPADLPYVQAANRYARGVARTMLGDTGSAREEHAALAAIRAHPDLAALEAGGVPARALIDLAAEVLAGRIAMAEERFTEAAALFARAVSAEDALPYTEPPFWYYPTRQSLGAALLLAGRIDDAESTFREILRTSPRNGWALFGMAEIARRRGNPLAVAAAERRLDEAWIGDRALLELDRL